MKKLFLIITLFVNFILNHTFTASAQRPNINEEDIVVMKSQQNVGEVVMKLLEDKMIDSALTYFTQKDAATKKSLQTISAAIQKYKGVNPLDSSPDAVSETENYVYCKYTADEGAKVLYRVDFRFARTGDLYKINKLVIKPTGK